MKQKISSLLLILIFTGICSSLKSQVNNKFTGEIESFSTEIKAFMGPNLNAEQAILVNNFVSMWDSTIFSLEVKSEIIAVSNSLVLKRMRANPHFIDYIGTILKFVNYDVDPYKLEQWISGLGKVALQQSSAVNNLHNFIISGGQLISDSLLYSSRSASWKILTNKFTFRNDSVFEVIIPETSLLCYTRYDSTYIHSTSGVYIPIKQKWNGNSGKVNWEKAGYRADDVYAEFDNYELDMTNSAFELDSVKFSNNIYFDDPVEGTLSDRVISISDPNKATYPRFTTYQTTFSIEDIYDNVDFQGGLAFEGSSVRGTGGLYTPAKLKMYRNDTLYVDIKSASFIFNRESIRSQSTVFTLYLDTDSIYHSDIAFTYNVPNAELNTYRSRFPTSRSPYYSSYHGMDMYFEYLTWKLNESKITLSRARGASIGQAYFESVSFFNENEFHRLMGLDDFHPLYRISKFAEYWYSETFPIDEFARWMKQSPEYATSLCIDLANKGFLFYDRATDEVTVKQKVFDYIDSYAKRRDYDVMSILSETQAPADNAILNMRNYKMRINGIPRIFLSDSQNVTIYPYDRSIVLERNRSFEFNGVVQAGMITIFGNNFSFSYDTFKIRMPNVDSIALSVITNERDEFGGLLAKNIEDLIQMTNAELLIDHPNNKSGLQSLDQYPIFSAISESYIFYDRIPGLEGVYPQSEFYFKLEPFVFENTDRLQESDLNLRGEFTAGKIMPTFEQTLSLQNDKSLGFLYEIPEDGVEIYEGRGVMNNQITMSNSGLKGHGTLTHLTTSFLSEEINMFPDSVIAIAETFSVASNTIFPEVESELTNILWYPFDDELYAEKADGSDFSMFNNGTELDGELIITGAGLSGSGELSFTDSRIVSNNYSFTDHTISADSSTYNLNSISGDGFAFIAEDASTFVDFDKEISRFSLNSDKSLVMFPEISYICTMTDFEYDMQEKILTMDQKGRESTTLMPADELIKQDMEDLENPTFFSTHMVNDTIKFSATRGRYLLQEEKIITEEVNYIKVADALIQPDNGVLRINKGARFDKLNESLIAINNKHLIHSAQVNIMNTKRYEASGIYDYIDENNEVQPITFSEIIVDSLRSKGTGYIPQTQNFKFNPHFTFSGDVHLKSSNPLLNFLGSSGIVHDCNYIGSTPMKFNADIDPLNIMIPVIENARDINNNLITAGTYITIDSTHIYSAFLSKGKSWSDIPLVDANGWLIYDKNAMRYKIAEKEKLANSSQAGPIISFNKIDCSVFSEGPVDLGLDYGLVNMSNAGDVLHTTDSAEVDINIILALDFHFSEPALTIMADEIRFMAGLEGVDLMSERYSKAMQNLIGAEAATRMKEDMDLYGMVRNLPSDFNPEIILNDLKLVWNDEFRSYRSVGKIGIGFVGPHALNVKVDGYVELQKRRSGDMLDIYLKADNSTWFWFSYTRGVMMTLAGNNAFNTIIREEKINSRKHPDNSIRLPYTYMIGIQERLDSFLRRIEGQEEDDVIIEDPLDFKP